MNAVQSASLPETFYSQYSRMCFACGWCCRFLKITCLEFPSSQVFLLLVLWSSPQALPRALWSAFPSTHSFWVRPVWLITEIMQSKQTHIHKHTQGRLRERATGGTLSCALSMKSQLVRMSHIPGWTKEEVGLAFLLVTQQGWVCVGRGTGWWKTIESFFFFFLSWPLLWTHTSRFPFWTDFTSHVFPFPVHLRKCLSISIPVNSLSDPLSVHSYQQSADRMGLYCRREHRTHKHGPVEVQSYACRVAFVWLSLA